MISKRVGEQAAAVFLILAAAAFFLGSRPLNYQAEYGRPGPGFFPFWLSLVLLLVGTILFVQATRAPVEGPREDRSDGVATDSALARPLLLLVMFAVTVLLLRTLGFVLAVGLFLMLVMTVVERITWWKSIVVAVLGTVGFYFLFRVLLGMQLPTGVIISL